MIDKTVGSVRAAVSGIRDGATIMIGGFGEAGSPIELIHALIDQGSENLTVISNNAGTGQVGLAALIAHRRVAKMICSFPRTANADVFASMYRGKEIELELVPQGTLAERIRAAGAGVPAFYTPTAVGTELAAGKEQRDFDGRGYVLEHCLRADVALIKCRCSDRYGNLVYRKTARNFAPIMASAAASTIVQAGEIVEVGGIDPEIIVTPGLFVDTLVEIAAPFHEADLVRRGVVYP